MLPVGIETGQHKKGSGGAGKVNTITAAPTPPMRNVEGRSFSCIRDKKMKEKKNTIICGRGLKTGPRKNMVWGRLQKKSFSLHQRP